MPDDPVGYEAYIDTWYERTTAGDVTLGQLAIAPVSYHNRYHLRPCDIEKEGIFDKLSIVWKPEELGDIFNHKEVYRRPVLKSKEEMIASQYKRRFVILLGIYDSVDIRPRVTCNNFYYCIPLYTLHNERGQFKNGFSPEHICKIKLLEILNLLILPESEARGVKECIIDFDRIQVINVKEVRLKPTMVSMQLLSLIINRMSYYYYGLMHNDEDDSFVYYWKELMKEAQEREG